MRVLSTAFKHWFDCLTKSYNPPSWHMSLWERLNSGWIDMYYRNGLQNKESETCWDPNEYYE